MHELSACALLDDVAVFEDDDRTSIYNSRQTIGDDEGRFAHAITARWPIDGVFWKPGRKSTAADSHLTSFFNRRSSGTITDEGAMMEMPCAGANNLAM
jgi:hypothetical protein